MKALIPLLFLILTITACKSPVQPEEEIEKPEIFEPYTIGNWLVTAPDSAKWVGDGYSAKSAFDTVMVTGSDDYLLHMARDSSVSGDRGFWFEFTDSTTTNEDSVDIGNTTLSYSFYNGSDSQVNENGYVIRYWSDYVCNYNILPHDTLYLTLHTYQGEVHRVYSYDVRGLEETLDDIFACE